MFVIPASASPERRWLAHLVRAAAGAVRAGDRFDDAFALDPAALRALALRHRVTPLLHRGLSQGAIADPIPDDLRAALRRDYYATLRKNVIALEVGAALLADLDAAGVPAAPLKGWALLDGPRAVYPDAGVRPMDDLDLIVARYDCDRASEVLRDHGFAPVGTRQAARLAAGHEMAFHRRIAGVNLFFELHWAWAGSESLMRGFAVSGEEFLGSLCEPCQRSPEAPMGVVPERIGHLLFVAVHAARHAFSRWIWLLDLHRLVEHAPVDWERLLEQAHAYRCRRPLYAGLAASRELFRTAVPKEVLAELAPGPVRRQLLRRSLAGSAARDARGAQADPRAGRVAKLLLGESWWDVARTAAWAAAPGRSWYEKRGEPATLGRRLGNPVRVLTGARERRALVSLDVRVAREPGIVARAIAGETILVPVSKRAQDMGLFTLNEVGTFVWERLDGERELSQIADELSAAFEVDVPRAREDLLEFTRQLTEAGCAREVAS